MSKPQEKKPGGLPSGDWRDQHFNLPPETKRLRDYPDEPRGWGWIVMLVMFAGLPLGGVSAAYFLGWLDPFLPPRSAQVKPLTPPPAEEPYRPKLTINAQGKRIEDEPAPPAEPAAPQQRTISETRASQLRNLIASRERGLDLLRRDRGVSAMNLQASKQRLEDARRDLADLEKIKIAPTNTKAQYEWNIAHTDAVARAKNAASEIARLQTVVDSFDHRMAQASKERDDAQEELSGSVVVPSKTQ